MMPPGFGLLENGNGRPHMIKAPGTIGMPSPGRSVPEEVWDIKTMAAHRHMILVAENWSQRTEMEAQMRAIPPQAYPPGFRPPPQHSASLPQSCPSGFGPRVQHVERSTVKQPETKFCSGDPIIYRQESYLDNRPRDPVGIHGTMWGSYMYGAAYRHGWYPNESSSGAGGVCGSGFVAPSVSKPHILAREPEDGHVLNLYRGAVLENENWRRDTHRQNGQSLSPIPVSNATPPLASYTEAFWLGKIFGSTRDAGKRCSFDGSDNTSPPFKRLRIGHEVDSPSWVRSRRESEIAWLNDLQMSGDRSRDCEASYPSSLLTLKQTERRNKTESSDGNVDRWHDRQELRTRRSSPHYQSGSLSPRDRNRAPIILEGTQKSELFSRPSSFRVISQSDRSTLRASPRPVYSNGKEKQFRNNPCFDARSWPSNCGSWSPRLNRRSQSPNSCSNYDRRSLRVGECSWRRDSWPPRLLAGRSGSGAETDEHVALWRSADCTGEVEKKMQEDGSLITLHFSQVVEEHAKDDTSPSDFQSLDVRAKQKSQRGTEDHLVQMVNNFSDNMALASIDRIKNDKALSLPLRAGTIQKFVEMEPEAEQCDSLEKNLPLHRNGSQFYDEKAGLSCGKPMTTIGENRSASIQPISATSLKIVRCFTNARSALKYRASQDSEVNWNISPEKVTPRRRRTVVVSAGPSLVKRSGSDEGAALPTERQDEAGEVLHTENSSKSSLSSRFLLEGSSIASEIRINQGSLMKPFVGLLRVSSEVTVHPPSVVRGTDSQVTTVRKVASCGSQRAGKKWISPGLRSRHIPKAKLLKTASGSDLQSPESLGKSRTFGGCLLAKDAPGCSWSQQTEGVSPTLTVRDGRVTFRAGVKRLSDNSCVPRADLSVQDKNQEIYKAGKIKSDVASFKDSSTVPETQKPKLPFMAEKFFLQESTVHGQNSERDHLVKSETEGQLMSSCLSSVGDMRVNPVVGKSGLLLDDWLFRITSSIPLAIESNKGFQPNGSTSESSPVFAKSGLQDRLTSEGDKQIEQLSGLFRGKSTSVIELAKVMTDKPKAAVMQGNQNTKVVSQFSDASGRGDKLARQLNREYKGQGNPTAKVASILTNAGASLVTEGTEVMSIVPQRSNLQDLTNPGGNTQAEKQGKVSMGDAGLATKLVRVMTGEGEATLTDGEDDFEVITEPSGVVVTTVLHFNRELGKRRKIMHPESRGNLKQVIIAVDPSAKVMKTNILESSGGTGKIKADSILMKKQMPSLNGGMQRTVSFLKTKDALSLPNRLSVPPAVTPPLYTSNKTWRREATPANSQQFSCTPQKPAVNAQPSTYVRKNFSIIRYPTSQVPPPSNVRAQPNALSKFPQGSVNQSRYKKYSLPASKSMGHHQVNTTIAKNAVAGAASANPNVNTLSTKMSELGAMPSEKPSPSPVRRLHSVGDETLVTPSESIVLDLPPVSKISLSKPSHCEGSSDLTTLVCRPATKSHGRATDEAVGHVVSGTRLFRKRQSDQIHVGPSTTSASSILRPDLEKCDVPLGYIRRKINQLVRCDYAEASANDSLQNMMEGGDEVKFVSRQRRYSAQLKTKTKLCRVAVSNQERATLLGLARVWTLSNEGKRTTTALGTSRDWRKPLLPWKRSDIVAPRLRQRRPLNEGKTGALFFYISNRLQKYRLAHPVYTRSADGFSLHRSGVMSKSGANLKWTKSLKTQSILASEAATKVVAEAEKKKRDKKEAVVMAVAKATDERREKLRSGSVDPSSVSSLKPLGIHRALYVRKGFGNELVRNSKTVARVVASEKFRWSLRNARLRRAKKQAFCVYYTRFGVCKRGDGKCLYIHDPEKVAVCTKFLRGSCSDPACHLTHKVIPERTSDCSYFLEGLCTNGSCPYRHVNVNKEAPICEAFLQGYCTDGDKCNKKHTYVCLQYTLTGSCSSSNCKLRHPKKIMLPISATKDSVDSGKESQKGSKREFQKGRYFTLTAPVEGDRHGHPVSTAILGGKIAESGDDPVDFISID